MTYMLGGEPSEVISNIYVYIISFLLGVIGIAIYTMSISLVFLILMQRTSSYSAFRAKIDRMTNEMEYYGLDDSLQERIKTYYHYLWIHQKGFGSHSMYHDNDLSANLRSEIALFLHRDFISKVRSIVYAYMYFICV